jgi:hypothetical protein
MPRVVGGNLPVIQAFCIHGDWETGSPLSGMESLHFMETCPLDVKLFLS